MKREREISNLRAETVAKLFNAAKTRVETWGSPFKFGHLYRMLGSEGGVAGAGMEEVDRVSGAVDKKRST